LPCVTVHLTPTTTSHVAPAQDPILQITKQDVSWWNAHRVLYATEESLNSTSETKKTKQNKKHKNSQTSGTEQKAKRQTHKIWKHDIMTNLAQQINGEKTDYTKGARQLVICKEK